ncbi:MAG TPA: peptide chain release factor N(5)-glutamine methyltransferase [Candidatus Mediterraneibacter faecavium]|uniref:Release factor glutamine methyltransferase n=1 Tax=Candidatus Mediterraneibacter faecavium TaxID=2838668 RepID=A0A9D2TKF1_9FIRM|nr:peptide chain release factor N(5)-glutamine methyltransferase [Candidatus Mediterraneibacter faecavium]
MNSGDKCSLEQAYRQGMEKLKNAGVPEAELDAWYLLEYVTGIGRASYYADPDLKMPAEQKTKYDKCIEVRSRRVPLQHITGEQEFMGLSFHVNEDVLIPRQDTEILVETALELLDREKDVFQRERGTIRLLDLCTGSGCILLSVLHYAKCRMEGTGSDLSTRALTVAEGNAQRLGIAAEFIESDLFNDISGRFSMILSNPPYIRSSEIAGLQDEVRLYDPIEALDGRADGLYFYRRIIAESPAYLEDGGYLLFEIGHDQAADVTEMLRRQGFDEIRVKKDLAGLDRVVYGRYIK